MNIKTAILLFLLSAMVTGCHFSSSPEEQETNIRVRTPVSVTVVSKEEIESELTLNATSSFLKKNILKSPATAYFKEIHVRMGDRVKSGQFIFLLQTKEAAAYKDIASKDTAFNYSGLIKVKAN